MKHSILIIDDDFSMCKLLRLALKEEYDVDFSTDAMEGLAKLRENRTDLVLLDLLIGKNDGIDILERIKALDPKITVIMMTAFGSIRTSVEAMKRGAFTYLTKPLDMDELFAHINQALSVKKMSDEILFLSDELKIYYKRYEMIGRSQGIQQIYQLIEKLKDVDTSVTITGESGTGKELVARAIHFSGRRSREHFVVINCAAIPEQMLEEELFGHKRGSFTGAMNDKKGKFEIADKGTVFLDEIGDMPLGLQSKLLRVLQQKEFTPLGGTDTRKVDIRVIAATNRNLAELVERGLFRSDLYYRLSVVNVDMPPLRERKDDIPYLCDHFIKQYAAEQNKPVTGISDEALAALMAYGYPGNVRQLANIIEYSMILCATGTIELMDLPRDITQLGAVESRAVDVENRLESVLSGTEMTLKEIEKIAICATLRKNNGRREQTAKALGISIRTLQNKVAEFSLQ